ncbi:unnamed protein product, partial [Prorocentrum cordatum]
MAPKAWGAQKRWSDGWISDEIWKPGLQCRHCKATLKKPWIIKQTESSSSRKAPGSYGDQGSNKRGGQKAETKELIAEKMGGMKLEDGEQMGSRLKCFARVIEQQTDPPKVKSKPQRLAEAAEALRIANKHFTAVALGVKQQRAWLRELEEKIGAKAAEVANQEASLEAINLEGKEVTLEGIVDREKHGKVDDEEVDETARQAVAEAMRKVFKDLLDGAKSRAHQLQEHIRIAKEAGAKNRETIKQDAKKREVDTMEDAK